jgi:hypothetical protein
VNHVYDRDGGTTKRWGPNSVTVEFAINDGPGEKFAISGGRQGIGTSFYAGTGNVGRTKAYVENRSNEAVWDVYVRKYNLESNGAEELFSEESFELNRYTGAIKINFTAPGGLYANSYGRCVHHRVKQF